MNLETTTSDEVGEEMPPASRSRLVPIVWALFLLLVLYPMSMPPAGFLVRAYPRLNDAYNLVYAPILMLAHQSDSFKRIADWYFNLWWPSLQRVNVAAHAAVCKNHLKLLENAKASWAKDKHKNTNDTPTWSELMNGYLQAQFVCPDNGVITIGRVGESSKCSVPSHNL